MANIIILKKDSTTGLLGEQVASVSIEGVGTALSNKTSGAIGQVKCRTTHFREFI